MEKDVEVKPDVIIDEEEFMAAVEKLKVSILEPASTNVICLEKQMIEKEEEEPLKALKRKDEEN